MTQTTVTTENIDMVRETMPCDQAVELEVGCVVTRWNPGDVLIADDQRNSEAITTTEWLNGRGAWCYGGDSVWGDVDSHAMIIPDDGSERYDLATGEIVPSVEVE